MTARQALESTYRDKADVFRRVNVKDPDTGQTRQTEERVLEGVICALSSPSAANLNMEGGYGRTAGEYTLFCPPDAGIREGDRLEVITEAGQSFSLRAGRGLAYISHAEIPVKEAKRA